MSIKNPEKDLLFTLPGSKLQIQVTGHPFLFCYIVLT